MYHCEKFKYKASTVFFIEDCKWPMVNFVITLRTGSLADPFGKAGLTRILFNMLLRGTKNLSRTHFNDRLENLGSQLDPIVGTELALLRGACLKRHLEETFSLVQESLHEPRFEEKEFEHLLIDIREELKQERDDDDALVELYLRRALFGEHPLGRSPLGEWKDLQQITLQDVKDLHKQRFSQDQFLLGFSGDVSQEELTPLVQKIIDPLPETGHTLGPMPPTPETLSPEIWLIDKPERTQTQCRLISPTMSGNHPDTIAFWLGAMAFGGTFTSTFCKEVREVRGWSYTAYAQYRRYRYTPVPFVLGSAPATEQAVDCLALQADLFNPLANGKLEGIDHARQYFLGYFPFEISSAAGLIILAIRMELLGKEPDEMFALPEKIKALSDDDVRHAMQTHLHENAFRSVVVATAKDIKKPLAERFPDAKIRIFDYREDMADA